jgi:hypothetical protein
LVHRYNADFDRLSTSAKGWTDELLVAFYIDGLRNDLRARVRSYFSDNQKEPTLAAAKEKARYLEMEKKDARHTIDEGRTQRSIAASKENDKKAGGSKRQSNGQPKNNPDEQLQFSGSKSLKHSEQYPNWWPATLHGVVKSDDKLYQFCRSNSLCFNCKWQGHRSGECRLGKSSDHHQKN